MSIDNRGWVFYAAGEKFQITTTQYCPEQPYVSLRFVPPPPNGASGTSQSVKLAVQRITFTTTSHDQGFSDSEDRNRGTYDASFTWFDARVLSPSGHDRVPRRSIQPNMHASLQWKTHINTWDLKRCDEDLRHWMASIRPGDTIQIVPKAHFPAWTNFVHDAKIELWAAPTDTNISVDPTISLVEKNDYSAYRPLREDLREVRVVEVQPGQAEEPIRLVLEYTRLLEEGRLEYDALSYCWGEAEDPQAMFMTVSDAHQEPTKFQTNLNLFLALKQLRHHHLPRRLWIDLLCINQTDMEERTHQVALMGEVFASARVVCVWLGESDADIANHCRIIRTISQEYAKGQRPGTENTGVSNELPASHSTHEVILDQSSGLFNTSFDRIFQLPWFERVWVLQEVWKASHVQVFCGSDQLEWADIMHANHCLKKRGLLIKSVLPSLWTALFNVKRDMTRLTCERAPKLDILHILIAVLRMKATDARDKVFAPLTFGEETHQVDQLPPEIKPNYEKNVVQVYADFTRWWIAHHKSLRILSSVHTIHGRSWINKSGPYGSPGQGFDPSQRPSWSLWHEGCSEWMHGTLALHDKCTYRASGDQNVDTGVMTLAAMARPLCLALRGITVSTIVSIDPYPCYQVPAPSNSMQEAFVRLFDPGGCIGTWNSFNTRMTVGESVDIDKYLSKGAEWRIHYISHWGTEPPSENGTDASDGRPAWLPCLGESMFTDDEGRVGLCPWGSQVGDLVVILFGGKVPYLLRPKYPREANVRREGASSDYYFVGECYAEGLMSGEACESDSDSKYEELFLLV